MLDFIKKTWKLNRAIMSEDYEKAMAIIASRIPIKIHKIASGTKCLNWEIPEKWIIKDAWVKDKKNKKIIDWKKNCLHVVISSHGINKVISKKELLERVFYSKEYPNYIPYRYCYYRNSWGFCCTKKQREKITQSKDRQYKVFIDANFIKGEMQVGEYILKGKSDKCIILMSHLDHPYQVQDGLSGCALLLKLAEEFKDYQPYYTLRILFLPERIGSIGYLSQFPEIRNLTIGGIYTEMVSVPKLDVILQHSKKENSFIDRISRHVIANQIKKYKEAKCFEHILNDDAVFNAPGIDIPCISITRSYALTSTNQSHFPHYHTSGDNLKNWDSKLAKEVFSIIKQTLKIINQDRIITRNYIGVPFLTKYNLWPSDYTSILYVEKILNNLEDGSTIFTLAEKLDIPFEFIYDFIMKLEKYKLVNLNSTESYWRR